MIPHKSQSITISFINIMRINDNISATCWQTEKIGSHLKFTAKFGNPDVEVIHWQDLYVCTVSIWRIMGWCRKGRNSKKRFAW